MPFNVGVPELLIFGVPAAAVVLVLAFALRRPRVGALVAPPAPGVAACYTHAWRQLWRHFGSLFVVGLVGLVLGRLCAAAGAAGGTLTGLALGVLVAPGLGYGSAYAFLRAARGKAPRIGDLFVPFGRAFGPSVVCGLAVTVATEGLPHLLDRLPVPEPLGGPLEIATFVIGAVLTARLSFVPFLVVEERRGPADAILESWRRTRGRFWTLVGLWLFAVPVVLAGLLLLVVGLIPAVMLVTLAHASFFAAATASAPGSMGTMGTAGTPGTPGTLDDAGGTPPAPRLVPA